MLRYKTYRIAKHPRIVIVGYYMECCYLWATGGVLDYYLTEGPISEIW